MRFLLLNCLFCLAACAAGALDIYFIDVEAGSATLVVSPSGQSMLIDAGGANQAGRDAAAIKAAGLSQLDYLLVTHCHADHFAAVPELARQVRIANWVDMAPPWKPTRAKNGSRRTCCASATRYTIHI